jgi:predicted nucleic acid-binding protein
VIVLDASAVVDVILDWPTKTWVLDRLEGAHLVAPCHQLAEVAAVAGLGRVGQIHRDVASPMGSP